MVCLLVVLDVHLVTLSIYLHLQLGTTNALSTHLASTRKGFRVYADDY